MFVNDYNMGGFPLPRLIPGGLMGCIINIRNLGLSANGGDIILDLFLGGR